MSIISNLRPIDQVLVWCFIVYALFIVIAICYVDRELIRRDGRRLMTRIVFIAEQFNSWIRAKEFEEFDPEWMDYKKWREANRR